MGLKYINIMFSYLKPDVQEYIAKEFNYKSIKKLVATMNWDINPCTILVYECNNDDNESNIEENM